ncbi:hypothetical protein [Sphingomonas canadensis]|nr:hypothetical protein [Sphingomonas canadensis]
MCVFGRHQRSRGKARETPSGWQSVCIHCGVRMHRGLDRVWHVTRD